MKWLHDCLRRWQSQTETPLLFFKFSSLLLVLLLNYVFMSISVFALKMLCLFFLVSHALIKEATSSVLISCFSVCSTPFSTLDWAGPLHSFFLCGSITCIGTEKGSIHIHSSLLLTSYLIVRDNPREKKVWEQKCFCLITKV